ncbi:rho GTPase-activating protein 31 [Ornithorhynchus anatinus]|uniref:rho GTPase-activating protein 31 n=1 Tax=Ornithorhynchus anatinus TaxID=9258 RepID=UPI0019D4466D|nr:rho GTPase-activating protein 31 [Ornithorhynchus anatinus]
MKNKLKRKGACGPFGCDLGEFLDRSGQDVPYVLRSCAEFIETHGVVDGVYRLSGVTSNIQKLRQEFVSDQCPDLRREVYLQDIHCVGSLCKLYFRELPNPLLTYDLYHKFTDAVSHCPEEGRLARIQQVIRELPAPHYRTLEYLIRHLSRVASFSRLTNMHARNLALVWAPNLLRSKDTEAVGCNGDAAFLQVRVQQVVIEFILNHVEQIFSPTDGPPGTPHENRPVVKSLTLPSLSSASMKLVSLEEAQARGLGLGLPARKERRENSLPDIAVAPAPAALFHTVLDFPDNKRKLSSKSKKWKSIFNLGRSGPDAKTKLSRNGSIFVRGQRLTEKATIRPAKSMDSLCSLPVEGDDTKGVLKRTLATGGFFVPATKRPPAGPGGPGDPSGEEEAGGAWGPAEGGSPRAPPGRPPPEQLKVFRALQPPEPEQGPPKMLAMFYTSGEGAAQAQAQAQAGFGRFPAAEGSPRPPRQALDISEPFAVSVPLRVSAVISTNSTPCRSPARGRPPPPGPEGEGAAASVPEQTRAATEPESEAAAAAAGTAGAEAETEAAESRTSEAGGQDGVVGVAVDVEPPPRRDPDPAGAPGEARAGEEDARRPVESTGAPGQWSPGPREAAGVRAEPPGPPEADEDRLSWPDPHLELKIVEAEEIPGPEPPSPRTDAAAPDVRGDPRDRPPTPERPAAPGVPPGRAESPEPATPGAEGREDEALSDGAPQGPELEEPWEEPQWVTSPLHSPTLGEDPPPPPRPPLGRSHSLDGAGPAGAPTPRVAPAPAPARGRARPASLDLDAASPAADFFAFQAACSGVPGEGGARRPGAPGSREEDADPPPATPAVTGRRNSAPVSVSAVRTSFLLRMGRARAVPVVPPKVQYTQVPRPLPPAPAAAPRPPPGRRPGDGDEEEEGEEEEEERAPTGPDSAPPEAAPQDAPVLRRKRASDAGRPGGAPLSSKMERSSGGSTPFFRARPGRPQSLILLGPPFPVTDPPSAADPRGAGPALPDAPGPCGAEPGQAPWVSLRNKMTIPKNGQRLETSTSCFYQPQRKSVILDGRSGRQTE